MLGRFSIRSTDEQVQALHLRLHPQYLLHKYCNIYQQFDRTPPVINQHTHKYTRVGERKRKAALITLCKKPSAASDQYALVLQTVSNVVEGSHRSPIWNGKGQMRSLTQLTATVNTTVLWVGTRAVPSSFTHTDTWSGGEGRELWIDAVMGLWGAPSAFIAAHLLCCSNLFKTNM